MNLSIALVNYNTCDDLAHCLESIQVTAGDIDHEIIVVDNGSTDGSAAMLRARFPHTRLIEPGRNTGYSEGNNIALRAAQGEYVLVLNPDTEVHPSALTRLLNRLSQDTGCGAVTARQVWTDGQTVLPICARTYTYLDLWLSYTLLGSLLSRWRDRRRERLWYQEWDRLSDRLVEIAPGSCLLLRREVLSQVGLFDETMVLYFSDDDLCQRLRAAGYQIGYVADAVITHQESASLNKVKRRARRAFYRDMATYTRKYHGPIRAILLMAAATPTRCLLLLTGTLRDKLSRSN